MEQTPVVVWQMQPAWGLPSPSPFCMKLEVWLRLAQIPHQLNALTRPPRSRSGKVPYIELTDGSVASDSGRIIEQLTVEWSVTLDAHLTPEQRAQAVLIRRVFEEHLYWVLVYERWCLTDGWKLTRSAYFGTLPPILRSLLPAFIRRKVIRDAWGQGLARLPYPQIVERAVEDLRALESLLGDKPYFLGDRPTSIDATAYGFLANMLSAPIPSETRSQLSALTGLVNYAARMRTTVYGEG